jgi:drug/metabolite transporter (DMT)-like permease
MTLTATILLIVSAFTHAGWNFISKKEYPSQAFYLVSNTFGVICVLPILLFYWSRIPMISVPVWLFMVASGFFLAAYLATLAGAYRAGDISIAYPLIRSLPVIFVFIATIILGKGHQVSGLLIAGIILIAAGCLVLPMKSFGDFHPGAYRSLCCFLALLSALAVAGYTIVDDEALRQLRQISGMPFSPIEGTLVYMVLEGISCSTWQGIFVLCNTRERNNIRAVFKTGKSAAAITGMGIYLTWGLVLVSLNYVENVSYVAAFRQLSIPLGAIFGMTLLKEPRYLPKKIGIAAIFIGLVFAGIG